MGKYLPVIKTAECGSMTRAAQALGYTQPSLGYIINNIESELGVKLFYRDQRGMTVTEAGSRLLEIMRQIEETEDKLREAALASQGALLRVGIVPSVACQWIPDALQRFYEKNPDVMVKMEYTHYYLDGELGVREHNLDACFFTGKNPVGMESIPLYEDPYYLVVSRESPLAQLDEVSVWDLLGKYKFIPTNESFDGESAIAAVYKAFERDNLLDVCPQENQMPLAMVARNLGITILPELDLMGRIPPPELRAVPLKEGFTRTVCFLCPRASERTLLTTEFLQVVQKTVEDWRVQDIDRAENWKRK
ncbi:MAG: LysR family transcriptional regulator [Ruminiclostridium sp.]|nr:LysR family transcriptional regulator [Ruminiclostridium sp.]